MKLALTSTAVVALLAASAHADGVTFGGFNFDFNSYDIDEVELDTRQIIGEIEYEVGQFLLGAGFFNLSASLEDEDADSSEFEAFAGYFVTPEVLVGLGVGSVDNDDTSTSEIEAFGQFRNDQAGAALGISVDTDSDVAVYTGVGKFNVAPEIELGAAFVSIDDVDGAGYVLSAEYDGGPVDVRAAYAGNTDDEDFSSFLVRGSYEFGRSFRALGALETYSSADFEDLTVYSIGAGYKVAEGSWIDASIGQIDTDGGTTDTLAIAFTFETGNRTNLITEFYNKDLRADFTSGAGLLDSVIDIDG